MEELEDQTLSAEERRARDAVRSLAVAEPDPEFRARLRDQFVTGRLEVVPFPVRLPWHRRPMTHWTLAAAAAVALVAGTLFFNQGAAWRVVAAHGEGTAIVDGRPVALSSRSDFRALFRPGTRIVMPEGVDVALRSGDAMLAEIAPGSDITVPSLPGRWFMRTGIGEVRSGELRLTTGAGFRGATLALATPDAHVMVTGTTLAVICEPTGTCVCVLEGAAHVGPDARSMEMVTAGTRGYVFADGRKMEHAQIRPEEMPLLGALRDSGRELLQRAR